MIDIDWRFGFTERALLLAYLFTLTALVGGVTMSMVSLHGSPTPEQLDVLGWSFNVLLGFAAVALFLNPVIQAVVQTARKVKGRYRGENA